MYLLIDHVINDTLLFVLDKFLESRDWLLHKVYLLFVLIKLWCLYIHPLHCVIIFISIELFKHLGAPEKCRDLFFEDCDEFVLEVLE